MKPRLKPLGYALGTLLALSAVSAQAALLEFFGEDLTPGSTVPPAGNAATARQAFLAALSGVGNNDLESQAPGSIGSGLALSFPGSSGSITATLTDTGGTITDGFGTPRFATSPVRYLETDASGGLNIAFSPGISAFGFYVTDIGNFGGQLLLQLTGGSDPLLTIGNNTSAPDGSLLFYGFIDDANSYSNIAITNSSTSDIFGIDDIVVGDAGQVVASGVPIPTTLALVGLGFAGIGFQRRRRNTSTTKG